MFELCEQVYGFGVCKFLEPSQYWQEVVYLKYKIGLTKHNYLNSFRIIHKLFRSYFGKKYEKIVVVKRYKVCLFDFGNTIFFS